MTRIIGIAAGKGGVGKTTLTSNLTYALTALGEDVIAIDANLTTPHLGLHFGTYLPSKSIHDLLKGKSKLKDVIYSHPYGFKFIPGSMSTNDLIDVDISKLPTLTFNLLGKVDFVLIDCAPSLGREAISAMNAADEILLVTNPDLPSVVDALKTADVARQMNKSIIGVVVNRKKGGKYELGLKDIRDMLELPVIAQIPEDKMIPESIAAKQPIIEYAPDSSAAIEINMLAHRLTGREFTRPGAGFFGRLFGWLGR